MKAELCFKPKGAIYAPTDIFVDGIDVYFIANSCNRPSLPLAYRDRGDPDEGQLTQVQSTSSLKKRDKRAVLSTVMEGLCVDGDVWLSGGQSGIYRSEDAGVTWRLEKLPTDEAIISIVRRDGVIWAAGQYGWIGWRDEAGSDWHAVERAGAPPFKRVTYGYSVPYTRLAISRLKLIGDRVYAIGLGIWRLDKSGATRELASDVQLVDMTETRKGTLIAAGFDGALWRKEAGAAKWSAVKVAKPSKEEGFVAVVTLGDQLLLVANRGKHPLRFSKDDGNTFKPVADVMIDDEPLAKFIDSERRLLRTAVPDGHGGALVSGYEGLLLRVSPEGGLGPWKDPKKFAATAKASRAADKAEGTEKEETPARKKSAAQIREENRNPSPPAKKTKDPKKERQFLDAIIAAPDDDAPRLVYADWLTEHGDPRGELIQVQCTLAAGDPSQPGAPHPNHVTLAARSRQLVHAHGKEWLAPIKQYLYQHHTHGWQRGFLNHITGNAKFYPGAAEIFALHPVSSLTCEGLKKKSDLDVFAKMPMGVIRTLSLAEQKISPDRVRVLLGERMANIEWLFLWSNPLGDEGLAAIAKESHLRKLRGLSIPYCEIGDAGLEALASSPVLDTIELLNFVDNPFSKKGISALANSPHLKKLKWVSIGESAEKQYGEGARILYQRSKDHDPGHWEPY